MAMITNASLDRPDPAQPPALINEVLSILAIIRRRHRILLALFGAVVFLSVGYLLVATPIFRATAQVALDPRRVAVAKPVNAPAQRPDEPLIDSGRADSEAQTMASDGIVRAAVVALNLQNDPQFLRPGLRRRLLSAVGLGGDDSPPTEDERIDSVTRAVIRDIDVERLDKSYVIAVNYDSSRPEIAARVANAVVDAYINDQFAAQAQVGKLAADWLKSQLDDLAKRAAAADAQSVAFRRTNSISLVDGKVVDEQQLTELTTQLSDAIAARSTAKANLDRIAKLDANEPDVLLSDAFKNEVINKLRQKYLENANKTELYAAQYGGEHEAVQRLKADNAAIAKSIRAEMARYQDSYRSDYLIADERAQSLRRQIDEQFRKVSDINSAQVKLNELDSNARTLRVSYEAVLQRFTDMVPKQNFPVSEARVITPATPPTTVYKPKPILILAGGFGLGLILGLVGAFAVELSDRSIRTRREAEETTGAVCLGHVPLAGADQPGGRRWAKTRRPLAADYVTRNPFSVAAETLRGVKTSIDLTESTQVIGVMSCLPHEGKTTIAVNLAGLIAQSGASVLLVDGDLRNPRLTQMVSPGSGQSLGALLDRGDLRIGAKRPFANSFDFISLAPPAHDDPKSVEVLSSPEMRQFVALARQQYQYVIVDLAPVLAVVDVRAVSPLVDGFLLVIDWAKTPRNALEQAMSSAPHAWNKLIGCIFNRTEIKVLSRYGENVQAYYSSNYFKA